jgi:DNA-binding transcriptional regulator YdaS (Cro superfamily)
MRKKDALNVFGSASAIAEELEISLAAVSQWGDEDDLIPPAAAHTLARKRPDKLRFDPKLYRHSSPQRRALAEALSAA